MVWGYAMIRNEGERLRSFGRFVEFQTTRGIALLGAVDDVKYAYWVVWAEMISLIPCFVHKFIRELSREKGRFDEDGSALAALEAARDAVGRSFEAHVKLRSAAAHATEQLDALATAHSALNGLCWALGEHEADFDKIADGRHESAAALIAALKDSPPSPPPVTNNCLRQAFLSLLWAIR